MKRTPIARKSRINPVSAKRRKRSGQPGKVGIVRLFGKALTELRRERFERDGYRCVKCGQDVIWERYEPNSGHMAHRQNKRMYGDHLGNVDTNCSDCHLIDGHNPKSVPSK